MPVFTPLDGLPAWIIKRRLSPTLASASSREQHSAPPSWISYMNTPSSNRAANAIADQRQSSWTDLLDVLTRTNIHQFHRAIVLERLSAQSPSAKPALEQVNLTPQEGKLLCCWWPGKTTEEIIRAHAHQLSSRRLKNAFAIAPKKLKKQR